MAPAGVHVLVAESCLLEARSSLGSMRWRRWLDDDGDLGVGVAAQLGDGLL